MAKVKTAKKINRGTSTSTFGTVTRQGHDSSKFYDKKIYSGKGIGSVLAGAEESKPNIKSNSLGKLAPKKSTKEIRIDFTKSASKQQQDSKEKQKSMQDEQNKQNQIECPSNVIYCRDSRSMNEIPDNSLGLMITSPPYNVGKEYDEDLSLAEYTELLRGVFTDTYRVLCEGGRACINIANIGRKPYIPLHAIIIKIMDEIGFMMRGEIIWNKAASAGGSCAWGSWCSANNPVLRDVHEYILIYSKGSYSRQSEDASTIERGEFLEFTKSIWTFHATSARKAGHPAPFPIELPRRLIELYSFKDDIVLDPFIGSGSTAVAAIKCYRRYIGYDISADYVKLAKQNILKAQDKFTKEKEKASMNLPLCKLDGKSINPDRFVGEIEAGKHPEYHVVSKNGKQFPRRNPSSTSIKIKYGNSIKDR